jgi:hypothetical protein
MIPGMVPKKSLVEIPKGNKFREISIWEGGSSWLGIPW